MSDRTRVTAAVESYWLEAGLSPSEAAEMRSELEQHQTDAASKAGHSTKWLEIPQRSRWTGPRRVVAIGWPSATLAVASQLRPSPPGMMCKVDRQEKNGYPVEISSHTGSALLR